MLAISRGMNNLNLLNLKKPRNIQNYVPYFCVENKFKAYLNETLPAVMILGTSYPAGDALQKLDPMRFTELAYKQAYKKVEAKEIMSFDSGYTFYRVKDVVKEIKRREEKKKKGPKKS